MSPALVPATLESFDPVARMASRRSGCIVAPLVPRKSFSACPHHKEAIHISLRPILHSPPLFSLTPPPPFCSTLFPFFLFPSLVGEGDLSRDRLVFHSAQLMRFYCHHYLGQRRLHPVGSFLWQTVLHQISADFC